MLALTGRLRGMKTVRDSAVLGRSATDSLITKHVAKNLMTRVIIEGKYDERNGTGRFVGLRKVVSKGRSVSAYITPKLRQ
jgi:hypothetical protein